MYQFWIGAVAFGLFAEGGYAVGLPATAGNGGALEHMVVTILFSIACGAARVESRGAAVECFASGKEMEATFEVE